MRRKRYAVIVAIAGSALATIVMRGRGYSIGANTIVRCRRGHLFTTIWVPFGSLKSVRLGWWRFQRCPVGSHWTLVRPVRNSDLTPADRLLAAERRDVRIP